MREVLMKRLSIILITGTLLVGLSAPAFADLLYTFSGDWSTVNNSNSSGPQFGSSFTIDFLFADSTGIAANQTFGIDDFISVTVESGDATTGYSKTFTLDDYNAPATSSYANFIDFTSNSNGRLNAGGISIKADDDMDRLSFYPNFYSMTVIWDNDSKNGASFTNTMQDPYYLSSLGSVVPSSNPVPEPGTVMLFGVGMAGLVAVGRRRKK